MRAALCGSRRACATAALAVACLSASAAHIVAQPASPPETLAVKTGGLTLHALLWHPSGTGRFPAVLFNHGSYSAADSTITDPALLGPIFARHGYVFLLLHRQGLGLSRDEGTADADQMARALASGGVQARNSIQLALLEGEELNEVRSALELLRARRDVDARRIAVVGHSFGGSLSLLLAARDTTIRAAVVFGAAAGSWAQSPQLRVLLLNSVRRTRAAVFLIHTVNDYSTTPGRALDAELRRVKKPHGFKIYPAFGATTREGHNFLFHDFGTWESDVFAFLAKHIPPASGVH